MNFEIASFSSLSGTQPITWQVEYPRTATTDTAVSEIFISQKDLAAIVPLATVRDLACAPGWGGAPLCPRTRAASRGSRALAPPRALRRGRSLSLASLSPGYCPATLTTLAAAPSRFAMCLISLHLCCLFFLLSSAPFDVFP